MPVENKIDVPKATFEQVVKAPTTYLLIFMVAMVFVFVGLFSNSSDKVNRNCEDEKIQLRKDLESSRSDNRSLTKDNRDLYISLLVKDGALREAQKEQDTTRLKK